MFPRSTSLRRQRLAADKRRDAAAAAARGPIAPGELMPERITLEQVAEILRSEEQELREPLQRAYGEPMDAATARETWTRAEYRRLMAEAVERVTKRR